MKKLLIIFIVLSLILSSCAVIPSKNYDTGDTEPIDTPPHEEDPTDDTEYEEYDPVDDVRYEDIERREALDYKANYYGFQGDGILLNLEHPKEWELKEATVGFDIIREGKVIGYLIGENADDLEDWKVAYRERYSANGINVAMYIEKMINEPSFRYRFAYSYESDGEMRVITLTADYTEVDAQSEEKLCVDAFTIEKEENNIDGALLGRVEEYSPILILGNSFISTSNIGIILKEMLEVNAKGCRVEAISRGSAHIGTYIEDKDIIDRIHGGTYSAVFICGLYTMHQITNLEALKKACDQSKTALVIFPAHNEDTSVIASARSKFPSLICLNWKAELDALIDIGIDRWDLCIDDSFDHSKPLAGYVGAHMIYRAIYGEPPAESMKYALSQSYIDDILGEYAYEGYKHILNGNKITYLD